MDRLAALQAFSEVAATGSFSEAARRLRSSKSAVSRHVAALEADLGARLFHRTTRSLTLTEAGGGYLERVSAILADLAEADAAVSELQSAPRGKLRVNAPMSFGFLHLAQALPEFLALYPDVTMDLAMNDRYVDLVEEGFDVAVRIGAMEDSSLIARRLAPVKIVICATPDYLKQHGAPRTPQDLRNHDCIANSNMTRGHEWRLLDDMGRLQTIPVHGRISANNGDAMRIAVLNGLGISMLPSFIIGEDLKSGALVSLLESHVPQNVGLHAVYPHGRHLSPKVRAFVDFLARRFGPKPYWDS